MKLDTSLPPLVLTWGVDNGGAAAAALLVVSGMATGTPVGAASFIGGSDGGALNTGFHLGILGYIHTLNKLWRSLRS